MQRRDINAADAPAPAGQYSQAVEVTGASRTLYISGQVGIAADGSIPDDAEAQSALAWQNLQAQLRAAGMEIENLVKTTTIVPNPADIASVRAGRAAVTGAHRPASTLIVGGLANPAFQAFSAEYITNILETRARALPEPGPLQLTRRHDLLDIDIAPPDLSAYQGNHHDPE